MMLEDLDSLKVQLNGDDTKMEDSQDLFDTVTYRHGRTKGILAQNAPIVENVSFKSEIV